MRTHLHTNTVTVLLYLHLLIGATIFASGYFPLSFSNDVRASFDDLPASLPADDDATTSPDAVQLHPASPTSYRSHFNRTVIMIIDALRLDFVTQRPDDMPHVHRALRSDGGACLLNVHVQSPTVTLPRVKVRSKFTYVMFKLLNLHDSLQSITTGTVPNFIDVVLNFGDAAIAIDSIIHQLTTNHTQQPPRRIVFAGDDTWTKLFPHQFVRQLANRDSLYVNDFHQGDANITRQLLNVELTDEQRNSWDVLVLHYLGLDHIGHVEGPYSAKVPAKLREMDNVVRSIQSALDRWDGETGGRSLLMVTGDHGMRDTGGHGGNSFAETNVPLFVSGCGCRSPMAR